MPVIHAKGLTQSDGVIFKTIPSGEYILRIAGMEERESREKKQAMIEFSAKVEGGEHNGENIKFWLMLPVEGIDPMQYQRNVDTLKRICIACGIATSTDELDTDNLMGASFKAVITETEKDGKKQNNVKDYLTKD